MAGREPETLRMRILDAALELLGELGPRGLTQPKVAKRAGIPQGHLTYYFPKKSDLLAGVARRIHEETERDLAGVASPAHAADFLVGIIKDSRRSRMLLGLLVAADEDEGLRDALKALVAEVRPVIALLLHVEPADPMIDVVLALAWGLQVQQQLYRRSPREVQKVVESLLASFGVAPTPEPAPEAPHHRGDRSGHASKKNDGGKS